MLGFYGCNFIVCSICITLLPLVAELVLFHLVWCLNIVFVLSLVALQTFEEQGVRSTMIETNVTNHFIGGTVVRVSADLGLSCSDFCKIDSSTIISVLISK